MELVDIRVFSCETCSDVHLTLLLWQCGCRLMNVIDVSIEVSFEFARLPVVMSFVLLLDSLGSGGQMKMLFKSMVGEVTTNC